MNTVDTDIEQLIESGREMLDAQQREDEQARYNRRSELSNAWAIYFDEVRRKLPAAVQRFMQPCYGDREQANMPGERPFTTNYEDVLIEPPGCAAILARIYSGRNGCTKAGEIGYWLPVEADNEDYGDGIMPHWIFQNTGNAFGVGNLEVALARARELFVNWANHQAKENASAARTEEAAGSAQPEYYLVSDDTHSKLAWQVQSFLRKGWQLWGAPFLQGGDICQALVRNLPAAESRRMWGDARDEDQWQLG